MEDKIIALAERYFGKGGLTTRSHAITGIGDDCAVVTRKGESRATLITTDLLIEDTHFKREWPAQGVGYKCIVASVSDIAAKSGIPLYGVLSCAFPKDLALEWIEDLFSGCADAAACYQLTIVGGDTTESKARAGGEGSIYLNFTLVGEASTTTIKYRSAAQCGDLLCVTKPLGASRAGVGILLNGADPDLDSQLQERLQNAHLHAQVPLALAHTLGSDGGVHAMMDISDGLYQDSEKMMQAAALRAIINLDLIPLAPDLLPFAKARGFDAAQYALGSGEEYGILCAVDPTTAARYVERGELFIVGEVVLTADAEAEGRVTLTQAGKEVSLSDKGFEHFRA